MGFINQLITGGHHPVWSWMFKSVSKTVMVQKCSGVTRPDPWFHQVGYVKRPKCLQLNFPAGSILQDLASVFFEFKNGTLQILRNLGCRFPTKWCPSDLTGHAVANCNLAQRCATPHYPSSFAFQIYPLEISKMDLIPSLVSGSLFFGRRCFCWFLEVGLLIGETGRIQTSKEAADDFRASLGARPRCTSSTCAEKPREKHCHNGLIGKKSLTLQIFRASLKT